MKQKWIVLGINSNQQVQAFGMFTKENTARAWASRMERKSDLAGVNFLAMPITPRLDLEKMLAERAWRRDPNTADLEN